MSSWPRFIVKLYLLAIPKRCKAEIFTQCLFLNTLKISSESDNFYWSTGSPGLWIKIDVIESFLKLLLPSCLLTLRTSLCINGVLSELTKLCIWAGSERKRLNLVVSLGSNGVCSVVTQFCIWAGSDWGTLATTGVSWGAVKSNRFTLLCLADSCHSKYKFRMQNIQAIIDIIRRAPKKTTTKTLEGIQYSSISLKSWRKNIQYFCNTSVELFTRYLQYFFSAFLYKTPLHWLIYILVLSYLVNPYH